MLLNEGVIFIFSFIQNSSVFRGTNKSACFFLIAGYNENNSYYYCLCGIAFAELRVISEKRAPADRKEGYVGIRKLYSEFFLSFSSGNRKTGKPGISRKSQKS
jgi:hypothetical protein